MEQSPIKIDYTHRQSGHCESGTTSNLFRYYGIDISENSIKYACENFESKDLEFIVADATYLPFPGEFFDFVVSFDALEHIDKQKIAIKEMVRVLRETQGGT